MTRDRFVTLEDYRVVLRPDEMGVISQDPAEWHTAEDSAMALVGDYLRHRYDVTAAYARRGDSRNASLVQYVVYITVWRMVHRLPDRMGYDRRRELYEEAMQWLADVAVGKATPDLPTYSPPTSGDAGSPIRGGSMPPSKYDW